MHKQDFGWQGFVLNWLHLNIVGMERERRVNPETARVQVRIQPAGLPAIWVDEGFCERCKPFGGCLGLNELTDTDWQVALDLLKAVNSTDEAKLKIKHQVRVIPCA